MIKVWALGIALNLRVELEIRRLKKFGAVEKVDSFCFFPLRYFCVLLRDPLWFNELGLTTKAHKGGH
jgi:hypothetical protein